MKREPICGAARTLSPGNAAVCERLPSQHAGLDHFDRHHGVHWAVCDAYCPDTRQPGDAPAAHICGRYRGDTAARYAGG